SFTHYLLRLNSMNWSGVDLFFVLSGFLIGGILLDLRGSRTYFWSFYIRRAFRILPLYFLVMAIVYLFHNQIASVSSCCQIASWFWYLTIAQNIWIALNNSWDIWYSVWSLGVEEQFYIILPFIIRFTPPHYLQSVVVSAIAASIAHRCQIALTATAPTIAPHVLFTTRADTLLIGVLCADFVRDHAISEWLRRNVSKLYISLAIFGAMFATMLVMRWSIGTIPLETIGYDVIAAFYI